MLHKDYSLSMGVGEIFLSRTTEDYSQKAAVNEDTSDMDVIFKTK